MNAPGQIIESADIAKILESLPHRYPFLMVDRVHSMRGDEFAVGIKNVTANEPQFMGHFPGNPVFPGVLMIEGMAQTAGVLCIAGGIKGPSKHVFFLTIDKAKFRKQVRAGRHDRVSHDQEGAAQEHVVVSRRRAKSPAKPSPRPKSAP